MISMAVYVIAAKDTVAREARLYRRVRLEYDSYNRIVQCFNLRAADGWLFIFRTPAKVKPHRKRHLALTDN